MNRSLLVSLFLCIVVSAGLSSPKWQWATTAYAAADGHDHKEGEGHEHKEGDGHEHKEGDGHAEEEHGDLTDLGTQQVGGFEVQVSQAGDVTPGEEAVFIIKPIGEGEPKSVRAWVGVESGKGSIKTKAEEEKEGEWHAHHKVSKPLPTDSKLWIELESSSGKHKASFELKKES